MNAVSEKMLEDVKSHLNSQAALINVFTTQTLAGIARIVELNADARAGDELVASITRTAAESPLQTRFDEDNLAKVADFISGGFSGLMQQSMRAMAILEQSSQQALLHLDYYQRQAFR